MTTTTTTQDFNVCPICGRGFHLYQNGKIRKHGFRSWGAGSWSNGCPMSREFPTVETAAKVITRKMIAADKATTSGATAEARYQAKRTKEAMEAALARLIRSAAA